MLTCYCGHLHFYVRLSFCCNVQYVVWLYSWVRGAAMWPRAVRNHCKMEHAFLFLFCCTKWIKWTGNGEVSLINLSAWIFLVRGYGLDSPGMESQWGGEISAAVQTVPGANQLPMQWVLGLFPGGKAAGAWRWSPHLVPRLKKVYSYTYTPPLGLHGPLQGELYLLPIFLVTSECVLSWLKQCGSINSLVVCIVTMSISGL